MAVNTKLHRLITVHCCSKVAADVSSACIPGRDAQVRKVGRIVRKTNLLFAVASLSAGLFWGSIKQFTDLGTVVWVGVLMVALGSLVTYPSACWVLEQLGQEVSASEKVDSRVLAVIWTTIAVSSLALWFLINAGPMGWEYE